MRISILLSVVLSLAALAAAPSVSGGTDRAVLAFTDTDGGDTEIVLADEAGRIVRRLTQNRASDFAPAWSPDGTRIALVSDRDGDEELYVVRADGTGLRQLTRNRAGDSEPAWSPDGRWLAFASDRDGARELWVMRSDGTGARKLTTRGARWWEVWTPAWSPDGRTIVFTWLRVSFFNPELYAVRPDGSGLRRLTHTIGDDGALGDDGTPAFSPDGSRIAFASNRTQNLELWTMKADGSGERRLVALPGSDEISPSWAPDGTRLAFTALMPGGGMELWLVGADGTAATPVGPGADPDWRPALPA
jgi:Tol biopolymer transport system component